MTKEFDTAPQPITLHYLWGMVELMPGVAEMGFRPVEEVSEDRRPYSYQALATDHEPHYPLIHVLIYDERGKRPLPQPDHRWQGYVTAPVGVNPSEVSTNEGRARIIGELSQQVETYAAMYDGAMREDTSAQHDFVNWVVTELTATFVSPPEAQNS